MSTGVLTLLVPLMVDETASAVQVYFKSIFAAKVECEQKKRWEFLNGLLHASVRQQSASTYHTKTAKSAFCLLSEGNLHSKLNTKSLKATLLVYIS
jgi:hypothetical protein